MHWVRYFVRIDQEDKELRRKDSLKEDEWRCHYEFEIILNDQTFICLQVYGKERRISMLNVIMQILSNKYLMHLTFHSVKATGHYDPSTLLWQTR